MNLHLDKQAFFVLINNIHKRFGYREDVIEKDYYVCLILKELSEFQKEGLKAYFKGGTALYKALKSTKRFSEDIDLTVDTSFCSRTQADKCLEKASKRYISLVRDINESKTYRHEVISIYRYNPISTYDKNDALQRFGKVKIEATSFTLSEPIEDLEISPLIYDLASKEEKSILKDKYNIFPFDVKSISLERIFVDKLFAIESYIRKSYLFAKAFDVAKHMYDVVVLYSNSRIISLLKNEEHLHYLLTIRIKEEYSRLDGIKGILPREFTFFNLITYDNNVKSAYEIMQKQYIFQKQDIIKYEDAIIILLKTKNDLFKNKAWSDNY